MDRISRLFGKKTEPSGKDEMVPIDTNAPKDSDDVQTENIGAPTSVAIDRASKDPGASPDFGLKFILDDGSEHLFTTLPISIGRGRENDLILADPTVSDLHAVVYFDNAAHDVCIVDQDSINGLCIDGLPTCKNILHDGVTINLGFAKIRFRDTGYIHSH